MVEGGEGFGSEFAQESLAIIGVPWESEIKRWAPQTASICWASGVAGRR